MSLYEDLNYQIKDLFSLYRFEGASSRINYSFQQSHFYSIDLHRYIYFSKSNRHHGYYTAKRLKQFINQKILSNSELSLSYPTLLNHDVFKKILSEIENYDSFEPMMSIEFRLSSLFQKLLEKNYVSNHRKAKQDRRIECVDVTKYQGGIGLCGSWLTVYQILTYFYCYQRITKENLFDFLYALRYNAIHSGSSLRVEPTSFLLNSKNRVVRLNEQLHYDFKKYELMNALQEIVEQHLYFPNSILATQSGDEIRRIVEQYCSERNFLLQLSEEEFQRSLRRY